MKKERSTFLLGFVFLLVFLMVSFFTFDRSNRRIEQGYLASQGNAAKNFAVLAAKNIHLTDEQVSRLKNYSYGELHSCEENESLRDMMDNDSFSTRVDYAYVMVHLKKDEVRYWVTPENQSLFEAPVGTPLDILWLLDVNVSPESEAVAAERDNDNTEDIHRYSYYIEEDQVIFGEAPTYLFNESEWGDHICGYAPLYSVEGSYIGVLGVELQTSDFDSYRTTAMRALGTLLMVSSLVLILLFTILYQMYRRVQFEKIYTDPLTSLRNRSYYNDQLIHYLDRHRAGKKGLALIIADIDWFKRVNDTFGHEIGDEVLIEVGQMLKDAFGAGQVVRFGGEEFVACVWFSQIDEIKAAMDGLYGRMGERKFTNRQIDVSFSMGCCYFYPQELSGWLMSGMLRAADCKLYEAKENGRRHYRMVEFEENAAYEKGKIAAVKEKKEEDGPPKGQE